MVKQSKGGLVLIVVAGMALSAGLPAGAGAERGEASRAVSAAIGENKPAFTDAEKAVIEAKCGYAPGQWTGRHIHIQGGVLECGNGRTVDDPEVRAILAAFGERVRVHVDSVMKQVRVRQAIGREAMAASREAMRDARVALRDVDRAHIAAVRAAAARARAEADSIDAEAILRQVDEALDRGLAPLDREG